MVELRELTYFHYHHAQKYLRQKAPRLPDGSRGAFFVS